MLEKLISTLAPHYCVTCRRPGQLLCAVCAQEVIELKNPRCIGCYSPTADSYQCKECAVNSPLDEIWIAGDYDLALKAVMKHYKFERARQAYQVLSELIETNTPQIFTTATVVSIPTIAPHIRQRGYDHAALLAKQFAASRTMKYSPLLKRRTKARQVGADRPTRFKQAANMFLPPGALPAGTSVLLVDDVVTTGATLLSAARALKQAGAEHVFATACAYEQLK